MKEPKNIISQTRRELGMTQKEAAALLGVAKRTYDDWEYGKRTPKPGLDAIAKRLREFGCLTAEARQQVVDGAWTTEEALAQCKIEGARRLSKWGAYGGTFTANLGRIPTSVIEKCNSAELAEMVDVIKTSYDDGYQAGKQSEV